MIRKLKSKDIDGMLEWMQDPSITQFLNLKPEQKTKEAVQSFIDQSYTDTNKHFAIINQDDEYLGTISLKNINLIPGTAEYAIVLRKNNIGKGYSTEATKEVLDIAFNEFGLHKVYLNVKTDNPRAIHFYEKIGFRLEEELLTYLPKTDPSLSLVFYSITSKDLLHRTCRLLSLSSHGDDRGHLVVVEEDKDIPFAIRRVFYMYDTKDDVKRGEHANRRSDFVIINLKGTVTIDTDNGQEKQRFILDKPHQGLYIPRMVWKTMSDFSSDAILLVLSSEKYDGQEYLRDYDAFIKEVNIND